MGIPGLLIGGAAAVVCLIGRSAVERERWQEFKKAVGGADTFRNEAKSR